MIYPLNVAEVIGSRQKSLHDRERYRDKIRLWKIWDLRHFATLNIGCRVFWTGKVVKLNLTIRKKSLMAM